MLTSINSTLVSFDAHLKEDDPHRRLLKMKVTEEIMEKINDAKFAWLDLIVEGHMSVICAKANGGKTTVMVHAASEMARDGYKVMYINADASASDIKHYAHHANEFGYDLINPDLTGGTPEEVIAVLKEWAASSLNFSSTVLILDTLKKFTDMMSKNHGKGFYSILRSLTAKGMTVICLAHTNKYDGQDGKPVFEGVGDLRNDFDELIYLIPARNNDGTITISTLIDKSRAALREQSFLISKDREVTLLPNHVDTLYLDQYQRGLMEDAEAIQFILDKIKDMSKSVTDLYAISKEENAGFSRKVLEGVLKRYCSGNCHEPKWLSMNASTYGFKYGMINPRYAAELKEGWGVKV